MTRRRRFIRLMFIYGVALVLGPALGDRWHPWGSVFAYAIAFGLVFWGILPLTRKRVVRRSGKYCVRCGYDLRATPERCPECGTRPAGVAGVASARRDQNGQPAARQDG